MTTEELEEAQYAARVIYESLTIAMHEDDLVKRRSMVDFAAIQAKELIETLETLVKKPIRSEIGGSAPLESA